MHEFLERASTDRRWRSAVVAVTLALATVVVIGVGMLAYSPSGERPNGTAPGAPAVPTGSAPSGHTEQDAAALELEEKRAATEVAERAAAEEAARAAAAEAARVADEEAARAAAAEAARVAAEEAARAANAQTQAEPGAADQRYGTCAEAIRAGHGPYYRGSDAEYDWYQDRDGDGVVCER